MDEKEITQFLRGTAWQGNLTASTVPQKPCPIRIVFLSELSADGALLYFHRLMGDVPAEIEGLDEPCEFTPRALKLEISSGPNSATGTISIFPCTHSEEEEKSLEGTPNRPSKHTLKDVQIVVAGDEITITARILGMDVVYQLTRQNIAPEDAQRSWLHNT